MAVQAPVIINFAGDSGTLGDGKTDANVLTLWGTAVANSTIKIYDGSTLLGSVTAGSSGSWAFETPKLADSAHTFTATASVSAETSPPSTAMSVTVVPSVTHFVSGTDNWSNPTIIDGQQWYNHNPGKSWSVTNPDSHTIRTEIRPNELWLDGGGERSEIAGPEIADGTVLNISYTMTVEPGTLNPGLSWLSLMQWHEGDTRPFVLLLDGEKMEFVVNLGSAQQQTVYHATTNIQRGQAYDIQYEVKFGTNGYLDVWLDGVQIIDYNGLLGTSSNAQYLKLGVYRGWEGQANYTMAVDYSNIIWSTNPAYPTPPFGGAATPPTPPTPPTTPPVPGAPTITSFSTDSGVVGDGITNDNTPTLIGSATANSAVKVYDGATLLGSATANSNGAWSYTTAALSNGSHSLTATATSGSGTSAASAARVVTVDTVAPTAPIVGTFSSDTGTVGDGITNDNTLALTGSAQANSTVRVYDGTTLLGTATANGSGAWSYTTGALSNGSHSLTATATDAAGNVSAASSALAVTIDRTPPAAPTIASFSNDTGTVGDRITHDNTLTLAGNAEANSTVQLYDGAALLGTATASGSGAWTYATAALTQGTHSFTARIADVAGNTAASAALAVTIMNQTPAASAGNNAYAAGTSVAASSLFSVSDADGDAIVTYRLYDQSPSSSSGRFLLNGIDQGSNHNIDLTPAQLAQTTFVAGSVQDHLWVQVYDGTTWSQWYEFYNNPPPNHAPTVSAADKGYHAGASVAASSIFSVSDADGDSIVTYRLYDQSPGANTGRFLLNGVDQGTNHNIDLTPAQFAQTTFVAGAAQDHLWLQVYDGQRWSEWTDFFNVNHAPEATVINKSIAAGTTVAASSLFLSNDQDGDAIVTYRLYDQSSGANTGRFLLNGVDQGTNHNIDLTPAQLAQTVFNAGSAQDKLWVQAYDGQAWSDWVSFDVSPLASQQQAPSVAASTPALDAGASVAVTSLLLVNDPDGDSIVTYRLYDQSPGANTGHFLVNGVEQGTNRNIDLTPAQLAQTTYVAGTESDNLWVQVYDGAAWSQWNQF